METILYATDFSDNAEKALIAAINLAKASDAQLTLLHVFDLPVGWDYPRLQDTPGMEDDLKQKLENLFNRHAKGKAKELNVSFQVVENTSIAYGIISVINELQADLVVVGSRGESKAKEIIVGSTTKALVREAPCPVYAVPAQATAAAPEKVLYATDFYEADLAAIQKLVDFLKPFSPDITVVHVSLPGEARDETKMEWFKGLVQEQVSYDKMTFQVLLADDIYERLTSYISQYKFDLLVMLEKGPVGALERLFHKDLVTKMEFKTSQPVLSFNEKYLQLLERDWYDVE
ncbi:MULTISPECIES: universal stress protein [unclassified Imperialibacter]|uniref:universal stress protein n=1 Tax=unclassified Imperialibacter TaxID=2629706 RepID=UPI00125BAA01|nr:MULTISPECIES: universal stress protein [unclassified Imperialibacter]CAD5265541.1 conserved hypothetical protein [Imperialibacter sp. 89]CAD5270365.1 conserved hypothetical protein [Imperialibacter sp. 75]VVT10010.1 conserved hypothetical protein [Imperialibacter sp. EC-SDR9]